MQLPATFEVLNSAVNTSLVDNVAAGSHRLVSYTALYGACTHSDRTCRKWGCCGLKLCVRQASMQEVAQLSLAAFPQGFNIPGDACGSLSAGGSGRLLFLNNVAHSNLVGLVLRAAADGGPCTALTNFTTYLNHDFGIITLKGITSDVVLQHVVVAGAVSGQAGWGTCSQGHA